MSTPKIVIEGAGSRNTALYRGIYPCFPVDGSSLSPEFASDSAITMDKTAFASMSDSAQEQEKRETEYE